MYPALATSRYPPLLKMAERWSIVSNVCYVDEILARTGAYQWLLVALCILPQLMDGGTMLLPTWTAVQSPARCRLPHVDNATATFYTLPAGDFRRYYVQPKESQQWCRACTNRTGGGRAQADCAQSDADAPCDSVLYGMPTPMDDSLQTEFDMGCAHVTRRELMWSAAIVGMAFGHTLSSVVSDKIGRKPVVLFCGTGMMLAQVATIFAYNYYAYLAGLFLCAVFGGGATFTTYVIAMEDSGPWFRTICSNLAPLPFTLGQLYVGLSAYAFRRWQPVHICMGAASLAFIAYYALQVESIRWLLINGKIERAATQLQTAAKCNRVKIESPQKFYEELQQYKDEIENKNGEESNRGSLHELLRLFMGGCRPVCATVATIFAWFAITMCYNGLAQNSGDLSNDIFEAYFLGSIVELPAYALAIVSVSYAGRRPTLVAFQLVGGACCIATGCIISAQIDGDSKLWPALGGRLSIMVAMNTIYQYSAELFPTVVRQTAMSAGSLAARIGAVLAPQLRYLLGPRFGPSLPMYVFGGVAVLSGILAVAVPETKDRPPPDTTAQFYDICNRVRVEADAQSPAAQAQRYASFSLTSAHLRHTTDDSQHSGTAGNDPPVI